MIWGLVYGGTILLAGAGGWLLCLRFNSPPPILTEAEWFVREIADRSIEPSTVVDKALDLVAQWDAAFPTEAETAM